MKKYYLTNGDEVKIGDVITTTKEESGKHYRKVIVQEITVTEDNIKNLIKEGIIVVKEINKPSTDLEFYKKKLETKLGEGVVAKMEKVAPAALFSLLLKEIAIEFDKQYESHISKCNTVWVVDSVDGHLREIKVTNDTRFRNFAAFRTLKEIIAAISIVSDLYLSIFPE